MAGQGYEIPEVPGNLDPNLKNFLSAVRKALKRLEPSVIPPNSISNLTATAKAGGAIIQFTRSDADAYILYRNTLKTLNGAVRIDLGLANSYTDETGIAAQKVYYWVKSKKGSMESEPFGPVNATTLALNIGIVAPVQPPGSQQQSYSDETSQLEPGRPTATRYDKV